MEARLILASLFYNRNLNLKIMKLLALAIAITAEAFKNTLDKGGKPYILHCFRVMNNTQGDEDIKCAAIMHDLIEDTNYWIITFINSSKTNSLYGVY